MTWKRPSKKSTWLPWLPEFLRTPIIIGYRISLAAMIVLTVIAGFYYFLSLNYDITDVTKLPKQAVLIDCNGDQIAILGESNGERIEYADLPDHCIAALLAREDARFKTHHGVDIRGLLRATARNIKDRSFTQGASTLSMQLTRNCFELKEKSLHRKLLEIAITLRIEVYYSKPEILTNYLNRIYFGSGCYGIEQASQTYFGKSTSELSLSESALIVGIIRGPHIFSPLRNLSAAIEQRNQTLTRMLNSSAITQAQFDKAISEPITLATNKTDSETSYAISSIKRHLQVIMDQNDIRKDGLRIHTTIDHKKNSKLQTDLQTVIASYDNTSSALQTAAVSIEHETGAIRCLIGGNDFSSSKFNRALDARRDLGSIITPFLHLAALERNRVPIKGEPLLTGRQIGPEETIRILKRLGLKGPFHETEDLFRGAAAATPLELATAFSTLAASGERPHTYFIDKITQQDGSIIFQNSPSPTSIAEPANAKRSLEAMQHDASQHSYKLSGYNGSQRDYWHAHIRNGSTSLIWVGCDTPSPLPVDSLSKTIPEITL